MTARIIEISEATGSLAEYAQHADDGPIVVTANGRPIAVVMAIENADLETISLSQNPQFIDLIERSRERQRQEGGVPSAAVRERLGRARNLA